MINEIAAFILAELPSGHPWILGTNFFVGYLPLKSPNTGLRVDPRAVVILERVPSEVVGDLPDYRDKRIQIWNRNVDYQSAKQDAESFFSLLHGSTGWDLPVLGSGPQYRAWIIDAVNDPVAIAIPEEKNLFEFSTNYIFRISVP